MGKEKNPQKAEKKSRRSTNIERGQRFPKKIKWQDSCHFAQVSRGLTTRKEIAQTRRVQLIYNTFNTAQIFLFEKKKIDLIK